MFMNSASDDILKLYCVLSAREWGGGGWLGRGASVNNKIPAGKMAAINRVQYHPPPPSLSVKAQEYFKN
jgi:hypothetical protein